MIAPTEAEQAEERLRRGVANVVALVRNTSPGILDDELFAVCVVASGVFAANMIFPGAPTPELSGRAGLLFSAGLNIGQKERLQAEKQSCHGAA